LLPLWRSRCRAAADCAIAHTFAADYAGDADFATSSGTIRARGPGRHDDRAHWRSGHIAGSRVGVRHAAMTPEDS